MSVYVDSIVGWASQFLGRAERLVTYYAGTTTLDTQQLTLWTSEGGETSIQDTGNLTVDCRTGCWAHYATQLVHRYPLEAVEEDSSEASDNVFASETMPETAQSPTGPLPLCTHEDIESLYMAVTRTPVRSPGDIAVLHAASPDILVNRFPGTEMLVQWKDGAACRPDIGSILPLAESVYPLSKVSDLSGELGVIPCHTFTDLTALQDLSGPVCTYVHVPVASQYMGDVTTRLSKAPASYPKPAAVAPEEAAKTDATPRTSPVVNVVDTTKADEGRRTPGKAIVNDTQETQERDAAKPAAETAKQQGKVTEETGKEQGKETEETAEQERREKFEKLKASLEKAEAKLQGGKKAPIPDSQKGVSSTTQPGAHEEGPSTVVRTRGPGLKVFKKPEHVPVSSAKHSTPAGGSEPGDYVMADIPPGTQAPNPAGMGGAGVGIGVHRAHGAGEDQAAYIAADMPPGVEIKQDSRGGSGWGIGVHALEMPKPRAEVGPTVIGRIRQQAQNWLRKVKGWESASVRMSLTRDHAGDGADWLATYEEIARTNGVKNVDTAWDRVVRVHESGGSDVFAGRGRQRQAATETTAGGSVVGAIVTRELVGSGMHQVLVTTVQWKDVSLVNSLGRCSVCMADTLTNSVYIDPDQMAEALPTNVSGYVMPRAVDVECSAPRAPHAVLRICTNYTQMRTEFGTFNSDQPISIRYPLHVRYHTPSPDGSQSHATAYLSNPLIGLSCGDPYTWRWVQYEWTPSATLSLDMPVAYGYMEALAWGATGLAVIVSFLIAARALLAPKDKRD